MRALVLTLSLVACSESHSLDADAASPDVGSHVDAGPPDDAWSAVEAGCPELDEVLRFHDDLDRVSCQRAIDCFSDVAASNNMRSWCTPRRESVGALCAALGSGRMRFDAAAATECRAALVEWATTDCFERFAGPLDPWWQWAERPAVCQRVERSGVSHLPDGSPADCTLENCPNGEMGCIAGATCGGTCRLSGEGERCGGLLGNCAPGLECELSSRTCRAGCLHNDSCLAGAHCIAGTCVVSEVPAEREPCLSTDEGMVCAPDTFCEWATSTCTRRVPLGGACTYGHGDDGCAYGWCTAEHICEMPDHCSPNASSEYGCVPELYCGVDGVCTSDTSAVACQEVAHLFGREPCPPGYWCASEWSAFEGLCIRQVALGAACDADVACGLGSSCVEGRCTPVVGLGEACGPGLGVVCYERFHCIDGRCAPGIDDAPVAWREIGEPCTHGEQCLEGACRDGVCAWDRPGESCGLRTCPHNRCEDGVCGPYVFVGDGEECDSESHFCVEPQRCVPTGELDAAFEPRRICRAPCPL